MTDLSWAAIWAALGALITGLFAWLRQRSIGGTAVEVAVMAEWKSLNGALAAEVGRVGERCHRLEESEERCQRELTDALKRLATLEGYEQGQGKARQDAAGIVAVERLQANRKDDGQ